VPVEARLGNQHADFLLGHRSHLTTTELQKVEVRMQKY